MRTLIYFLFIFFHGFFILGLPVLYPRKKYLLFLGFGLLGSFVFFILFVMILNYMNFNVEGEFHTNVAFGIIGLFFLSFFAVLIPSLVVKNVLKFHLTNNIENINKQPLKFFLNNTNSIEFGYRLFFFLGGFIIYYGICFGDLNTK
ncbi:hypothetical protein [Empedobacter sedimenti]|uniref:hypothetical protein n=1 Tax=Empedobacter sedimenti TaxID=3042610 RepID=UPI0024A774DF|nr:hypothetical protein [Empedobacter sedimenti]